MVLKENEGFRNIYPDDDIQFDIGFNSDEYDLEEEITTQWEGTLKPSDDKWYLELAQINFNNLRSIVNEVFVRKLKIVLACRARRNSSRTISNDFYRIVELLHFLAANGEKEISKISLKQIIAWRGSLKEAGRLWQLGCLRGLLLESAVLINPALTDQETITYLDETDLPGNPKGGRVNDSDLGRMTLAERSLFENRSRVAFQTKKIGVQELLTLIIFNSFGLRIVDYTALKVKDVHLEFDHGIVVSGQIDIPCAKSGGKPRERIIKGNKLEVEVAAMLFILISKRSPEDPLFNLIDSVARRQTGILEGHLNTSTAAIYLQKIIYKLHLGFNLNSYRFRYTVGTEAYRETGNPYVAAFVLRHSDIQNVRVYVNEIVLAQAHDRVVSSVFNDVALLMEAAIKANSFAGVVISKQNFIEAKLIAIRAREQIGNFDAVGGCTGKLGCAQGVPVACYCCPKFRPIREANHMGLLQATIATYMSMAEIDQQQVSGLVPAILGMAQVCYLTQKKIEQRA